MVFRTQPLPEVQGPQERRLEPLGGPPPLLEFHFSTKPYQSLNPHETLSSSQLVAPQHGRAVAGPSGKRAGSQQTWVLAPALPLLAV